jgi:hypothetical protein
LKFTASPGTGGLASPDGARRRIARAGGMVLLLMLAATGVAAQSAPNAVMPKSVGRFTDTRADCFLPDERQDYDQWIDQFRITIPGCDKGVIPPQKTIQSFRVYKQGSNRVIDCSTLRKKEFGTRFLDTYLSEVVAQTDAAPRSHSSAICAANMLYLWAKSDAITELGDQGNENQGQALISWTLGGMSAAYYAHPEVRDAAKAIAAPEDGTADATILRWFHTLSGPVSAMIDRERAAKNEDNLQYWRGFAILPTAFLTEDPKLMDQSQRVFDTALDQVTTGAKNPDNAGFLPFELQRGGRALHYQTFATFPIMGLALLSESEGCAFLRTDAQRAQLVALLSRTFEGRADPDIFAVQAARHSKKKNAPIPQIRTATVRDAPQLMYLANAVDPSIAQAVMKNLADTGGPAIKPKAGAKEGFDRLGGAYGALASAAKRPGPAPGALAGVCRS